MSELRFRNQQQGRVMSKILQSLEEKTLVRVQGSCKHRVSDGGYADIPSL